MTRLDIGQLVDTAAAPVVSMFLELEDGGDEFLHARNQKRFDELLHEADDLLRDAGLTTTEASAAIETAREVLDSPRPRRRRGLAVYLRGGQCHSFALADPVTDRAVVDDRPVLLPLMRGMALDDDYVVLALDRKAPRLMVGSADDLRELADAQLPTLDDIRASDDAEPTLQLHSSSPSGGAAVFHGQGGSKDVEGSQVRRWVRAVAAAVDERLARVSAPVVIVGVAEQIAASRRDATHQRLVDAEVHGSPQGFSDTQLRERVWPIVSDLRAIRLQQDLDRLVAHRGTGWVPDRVEDVCRACGARSGRRAVRTHPRRRLRALGGGRNPGDLACRWSDPCRRRRSSGRRPLAAILRYVPEPR